MKKDEVKEYLQRDAANMRSLNFSEAYIKENLENTQKWGNTGMLAGIDDPYVCRQLARLMENQRIFNESRPLDFMIPEGATTVMPLDDWHAQWRRVSIPAARRVFGGFLGYELVSVQVMKLPEESTYLTGLDERTVGSLTESRTRKMKCRWEGGAFNDGDRSRSLDAEARAVADFAEEFSLEVSREILNDLRSVADSRSKAEFKDPAHLASLVEGMSAYIAAKISGRDATWIVTGPDVAEQLREFVEWRDDENEKGIVFRGMFKEKWKLFEDAWFRPGHILMGHKDKRNHYFSGYAYCPYAPFNPHPSWWNNESQAHGHGYILNRYGKRLFNPNFYGFIEVENVPEKLPYQEAEADGESEE